MRDPWRTSTAGPAGLAVGGFVADEPAADGDEPELVRVDGVVASDEEVPVVPGLHAAVKAAAALARSSARRDNGTRPRYGAEGDRQMSGASKGQVQKVS